MTTTTDILEAQLTAAITDPLATHAAGMLAITTDEQATWAEGRLLRAELEANLLRRLIREWEHRVPTCASCGDKLSWGACPACNPRAFDGLQVVR